MSKHFKLKPNSGAVPSGVVKCVGLADEQLLLVVLIDGIPFKDVGASSPFDFETSLIQWKRSTLPSLSRSDVRFFFGDRRLALLQIAEVVFPKS